MRWLSPLLLSWCFPLSALAEGLLWENAWVRSMPPGTEVAAAYGRVTNQSDKTVVITAISSSMGEAAQIHDVIADGDQRRMVQLDAVNLAAGESTEFKPGGQHIMLLGVTAPHLREAKLSYAYSQPIVVNVARQRRCNNRPPCLLLKQVAITTDV